jgi:hypothetical protein
MHSAASDLEWALRLSGQLETLSELAEHLTYRVLELEERLAAQDQQLSSLQTASDEFISDLGEAMEERMQQTENRLNRIEGLLQGPGQRQAHPRTLQALSRPSAQGRHTHSPAEADLEETVFVDEVHGDLTYADDPHADDIPREEDCFDEDLLDHSLAS